MTIRDVTTRDFEVRFEDGEVVTVSHRAITEVAEWITDYARVKGLSDEAIIERVEREERQINATGAVAGTPLPVELAKWARKRGLTKLSRGAASMQVSLVLMAMIGGVPK